LCVPAGMDAFGLFSRSVSSPREGCGAASSEEALGGATRADVAGHSVGDLFWSMIVAGNTSYRMAQPPEKRVPIHRREEAPKHQRKERPSWPNHWKEQCPHHTGDEGQKVSLTPQILQMFSDGQEPQLLKSTPSMNSNLTGSYNASRNSSVSSTGRLNQYHGGSSAFISASASRWHRAAAAYTTKGDEKLPMVMCSPPGMLDKGHYVIRILRASLKQQFGVAFDILEARKGRLEAIIVSKDLPHLGIRKFDCLRLINGIVPSNLLHCRSMLQEAYSIVLVLQPWSSKALESRSTIKTSTVMAAIRAVDQPLLCLSEAVVTDPQKGKFQVSLHRSSLALPFSMPDWSQNARSEIVEYCPHLAVQTGDQLVSVNGVRTVRRKVCRKLLANAMSVDLVFRRDPNTQQPPKHYMQPLDAMGAALQKKPSHGTKPRCRNAMLSLSNRPVLRPCATKKSPRAARYGTV